MSGLHVLNCVSDFSNGDTEADQNSSEVKTRYGNPKDDRYSSWCFGGVSIGKQTYQPWWHMVTYLRALRTT